jgi:hypothetical protein
VSCEHNPNYTCEACTEQCAHTRLTSIDTCDECGASTYEVIQHLHNRNAELRHKLVGVLEIVAANPNDYFKTACQIVELLNGGGGQ